MASSYNNRPGDLGQMDLAAIAAMPLECIPTGHYSLAEYEVPLSAAELSEFGAQMNPLSATNTTASAGRSSTFIQPMTSPDWFMMFSVGVVCVPDAKVFAINGASVAAPLAAATTVPQFDGTIPAVGLINGPAGVLDATARYAQFEHGHATWQASWAFLNAYRMQMILTGKYVLFDELCAHVGACVSAEEWAGLGSPNIAAARYIRAANDRQSTLNSAVTGRRFIPQTMIAGVTPVAAPPPLAPVGYGGPKMDGIFGGWYPTRGILFYPGMPVQILFVRNDNDTLYHNRLTQNLGIEAEITWDANYSDILTATAAGAATGFSSSVPFKGGLFKQGVIMRGCSLAPESCVSWYEMSGNLFNTDTIRAMYATALPQLAMQAAAAGRTNGFVGDVTSKSPQYVVPGPLAGPG